MDIFVGNLPFKIKEEDLKEVFGKYGKVTSVSLIKDRRIGQNKGYGFVVMEDEKEATSAINALNGTELMERILKVSKSGEKEESDREKSNRNTSRSTKQGSYRGKSKVKKSPPVITYGDPEKKAKKKRGGVKLAKNFKVGKRKK